MEKILEDKPFKPSSFLHLLHFQFSFFFHLKIQFCIGRWPKRTYVSFGRFWYIFPFFIPEEHTQIQSLKYNSFSKLFPTTKDLKDYVSFHCKIITGLHNKATIMNVIKWEHWFWLVDYQRKDNYRKNRITKQKTFEIPNIQNSQIGIVWKEFKNLIACRYDFLEIESFYEFDRKKDTKQIPANMRERIKVILFW